MGTWEADPWGNDTACDWGYGLEEVDDLSLVTSAIQKVLDNGSEYLEAPDAEEAIAAADTLARLKNRFYDKNPYTEPVDAWVAGHSIDPPAELIAAAIKALDRILAAPSELLELWDESDESESWHRQMEELKKRLKD